MSIVLNEYQWAERMISNRDLGSKPTETLARVAKYYTYQGRKKKEVTRLLENFILTCDPSAKLPKWANVVDRSIKAAAKELPVILDRITVTDKEMATIQALQGRPLQRLAFTLLCIMKYNVASGKDGCWVNTPDNEIMVMANISASIKRQSLLFGQLRDAGLIRFSKRIDSLSVEVLFGEAGEDAVTVTDFRNLGYQYMHHMGEPYFECQHCGLTEKIRTPERGRPPKYCPTCAVEIRMKQNINSVMRCRGRQMQITV